MWVPVHAQPLLVLLTAVTPEDSTPPGHLKSTTSAAALTARTSSPCIGLLVHASVSSPCCCTCCALSRCPHPVSLRGTHVRCVLTGAGGQVCLQLLLQGRHCVVVAGHALRVHAKHAVALVALVGVGDQRAHLAAAGKSEDAACQHSRI